MRRMAYLEMIEIRKRFPGVLANDHVNLSVERGDGARRDG